MENKGNLLFLGNSVALNNLFVDNGVGFRGSLSGKYFGNGVQTTTTESLLTDLDYQSWFLGNSSPVYNVNNNEVDSSIELKDSYSLDSLFDDNALSPASSSTITSSEMLETPPSSPLSTEFEFENLFSNTNLQANDLSSNDLYNNNKENDLSDDSLYISSSSDEYNLPIISNEDNKMSFETKENKNFNVGSPDSGISSSDEMIFESESNDILRELFDVQIDNTTTKNQDENKNIILPPMEKPKSFLTNLLSQPSNLEVTPKKVQLPSKDTGIKSDMSKEASLKIVKTTIKSNRNVPYQRKEKTEEQKQRKKAQNRNAAQRYRHKKKDELSEMLEVENGLKDKNKKLKNEVESLNNEIDYLKKLMLDVISARLGKTMNTTENTN